MAWTFAPDKPVFVQIGEIIKRSIVRGEFPPGSQLPTVRQIAMEATVNPNTVQHAFAVLEGEGLIISKRTAGKFVTEDVSLIDNFRMKMAKNLTEEYLFLMGEIGISPNDALKIINNTTQ